MEAEIYNLKDFQKRYIIYGTKVGVITAIQGNGSNPPQLGKVYSYNWDSIIAPSFPLGCKDDRCLDVVAPRGHDTIRHLVGDLRMKTTKDLHI